MPSLWCQLKSLAYPREIYRHEKIYLLGDLAKEIYLLDNGVVMLSSLLNDGRELGHCVLSKESFFGEMEILNSSPRIHTATALKGGVMWCICGSKFKQLMQSSVELSYELAITMSDRLQRSESRVEKLACYDVAQRLRYLLLELVETGDCQDNNRLHLTPCPTHQDLATLIASTRETVSTIMGGLRRRKIIEFNRRELLILNKTALMEW